MSITGGRLPSSGIRKELQQRLELLLDDLAQMLALPHRLFSSLSKGDVPETAGLYVIYREEPVEVFYVGIAKTRKEPSALGLCDGLRFRIMENHLAYRGDDNFVKYVRTAFGLTSRPEARAFLQRECSVHWMEVPDLRKLCLLEHLAIVLLDQSLIGVEECREVASIKAARESRKQGVGSLNV